MTVLTLRRMLKRNRVSTNSFNKATGLKAYGWFSKNKIPSQHWSTIDSFFATRKAPVAEELLAPVVASPLAASPQGLVHVTNLISQLNKLDAIDRGFIRKHL